MKERTFKPKIKIVDDREGHIRYKSSEQSYSSPLSRAIAKERNKARIKKFNATHPDYKPPSSAKRKK